MHKLIVFNKDKVIFKAQSNLKGLETEVITLPIYIEVKYFNGVAPCGLGLKVNKGDIKKINTILDEQEYLSYHIFDLN